MANTKITTNVIADDAITTAKIADDQITSALVADDIALGGNPTTTTQSAGNNTTRIATTAFVTTALSSISSDSISDADSDTKIQVEESSDEDKIRFDTGGTERVIIDSTGVGIGTSSPSKTFHVYNTAAADVGLLESTQAYSTLSFKSSTNASTVTVGIDGAGNAAFENKLSSGDMTFVTNGSERARIEADGKVGIGTTSPSSILEVVDPGAGTPGTALKVYSAQNSAASDGLVFIHSDQELAPFTALNVRQDGTGDILNLLTDTTEVFTVTASGTFGMGAGSGDLAGSIIINNDGLIGTVDNAHYNTVLGWEAADDLTSGDSNTIVGFQAGYKVTSGNMNTFVGRLAGENLTTGASNIAIGYDSMGGGTVTGNYNIAIGHETLLATTSGYENICMGRDAGHDITSAAQNVAIGHEAMTKNSTATGNVCVGFQAGENCSGGGNVFIGYKAGEAQEGGIYNIMIGDATAGTHPSHSQAIVIGRNIDAAPGEVAIGTSSLGKIHCTFSSNATWSRSSDERLKQNITDSALGLDFINALRPVTYKWKPNNEVPKDLPMYQEENEKDTDIVMTGLVAQEVKTALDSSGESGFGGWGEDSHGVQHISDALFVYPLIKAVKELSTKLEAAEARIKTLEDA